MGGGVINAIASPFEGLAKTIQGIFTGNPGMIGQGLAGTSGLGIVDPNAANYVDSGTWGPKPGHPSSPGFGSLKTPPVPSLTGAPPSIPPPAGLTTSQATAASSAGTPSSLSPALRSVIGSDITGQLPGLVAEDKASGMTGFSPAFLSSQAGEASGFTNQSQLINQAVQAYLANNPIGG